MTDRCCSRMADDLDQICDLHPDRADCPEALIAEVRGGFGLIIHDGACSVIQIDFCPWCGAALPPIADLPFPDAEPEDDDGHRPRLH